MAQRNWIPYFVNNLLSLRVAEELTIANLRVRQDSSLIASRSRINHDLRCSSFERLLQRRSPQIKLEWSSHSGADESEALLDNYQLVDHKRRAEG